MLHLSLRIGLWPSPRHNLIHKSPIGVLKAISNTTDSGRSVSAISSTRSLSSLTVSAKLQSCRTVRTPVFNFAHPIQCNRRASTLQRSSRAHHPPQPSPGRTLDWNSFFKLRTSRRRFSLISSVISAIAVTGGAFMFLSTSPEMADEVTKWIPMDPIISMGLLTVGATAVGWLAGPVFGNTLWKLVSRSSLPEFTIKERAFFERIKKHRVNPQGASTNNPVPDYYGEKIGSVKDYRRWLKDQRAFNRKKEGSYPNGI